MQKKTIILLLVEAIIFLSILFGGYYNMSRKLDVAYQNIETYKGDVDNLELKNGELISIRDSYIMDKKEIQEELDITKKQYRELEKLLDSKIAYISKLEATIRVDSVVTIRDSIVYVGDEITSILFTYNDNWVKFVGESDILEKKTALYDISIDAPLTIGLTDNYQLFVKSPNPYVHFSSIDGYVVDESKLYPKKQKWSWGLQGGFGALYGLNQKQFDVGFYLGIGVEKKF
jgi:hypothetical protein